MEENNLENKESLPEATIENTPKRNWWKVGAISFFGIFFLAVVFYVGIKLGKDLQPQPIPVQEKSLGEIKPPDEIRPGVLPKGRIYYSSKTGELNQVLYYDLGLARSLPLPELSGLETEGIDVIDEDVLGLGDCDTVIGNFGCKLYAFNLTTKQLVEVKAFASKELLGNLAFFTPEKFAYAVQNNEDKISQIVYQDSGTTKVLENLTHGEDGRGGFQEDSNKLAFSPNGKWLLQISTSSPRSSTDFNVYLYNLDSGEKLVIANATQPDWVDNDTLVFRHYDPKALAVSGDNGLYLYKLATQTQTKIEGIGDDSYNPEVVENKILYVDYPKKQIWLYDLNSKEKNLLVEKALWQFWVTSDQIFYQKIKTCPESEECMLGFEVDSYHVYNLTTKEDQPISFLGDTPYNFISILH